MCNVEDVSDKENYTFIKGDICDVRLLKNIFEEYAPDAIIHLTYFVLRMFYPLQGKETLKKY